jgi:serine/threonine-protein kinase
VFFLRRADDAPRGHVSPTPPTSVTATPTASGTAASTVAAPEPVREVTLTVRAEPADAKVFLDGQPMSEGTKKLARDGAAHQVRAEARGYQTKTVSALLDQDRDITVVLEKERPGLHAWTPRPAHPSQPTTTPAPVATAVPTPTATDVPRPNATGTGRKPSRPLDPNNPWE